MGVFFPFLTQRGAWMRTGLYLAFVTHQPVLAVTLLRPETSLPFHRGTCSMHDHRWPVQPVPC